MPNTAIFLFNLRLKHNRNENDAPEQANVQRIFDVRAFKEFFLNGLNRLLQCSHCSRFFGIYLKKKRENEKKPEGYCSVRKAFR